MTYSYMTLAQAKANLAQRLYPSSPFYTDAELGVYLTEALRVFNSLSNFHRSEFVFNSQSGVTWYDLTTASNTKRPMTLTDADLIAAIQYHLLEPYNVSYPLTWAGSKQFTFSDIMNAISQIRDQALSESGCTLTQSLILASSGRNVLPSNTIDLRRVCWIPATSPDVYDPSLLLPADDYSAKAFEPGYVQGNQGTPNVFMLSTQPPLSFDVDVEPAVPGQYDILTVAAGNALSTAAATILPVPNDWAWVLKYGAMATLFSKDSSSRDVWRAKYCLDRYKQGIAALMIAPALLAARINDVPVGVDSIREADQYQANWQADAQGEPTAIFYAGLNMLAMHPIPNSALYSVTASVVENMPIPASDSEYLQVSQEDLDAILGEAQHLATFKCGGWEFSGTTPLHEMFIRRCVLHNSKLSAISEFKEIIYGLSNREKFVNPIFTTPDPKTIEAQ